MPEPHYYRKTIAVLATLAVAAAVAPVAGVPLPVPGTRARPGFARPYPMSDERPTTNDQPSLSQPSSLVVGRSSVPDTRPQPGFGSIPELGWWSDVDVHVNAAIRRQSPVDDSRPGEWIVRLKPGANPLIAARRLGCSVKRAMGLPNTYVFHRDAAEADAPVPAVAALAPEVEYFEPNLVCRVCDAPNDPDYPNQWGLQIIQMPAAWSIQKGTLDDYNPGVLVAIVDTGVSPTHPDLRDRLAPGGRDLYNFDNDPSDDNGHGTHVAGILAATTNNGVGVAGVTWEGIRILAVKAFNASGESSVDLLADGIKYAADAGARVINVSAGIPSDSQVLHDAVRYSLARPQKPIIVGASGNESQRHKGEIIPVIYPANYPEARVIAVAAVGPSGSIAFYSNANSRPPDASNGGVDIAAPGGNDLSGDNLSAMILSTSWDPFARRDFYEYMQGTSMATPFVSGAAALLLAEGVRPDDVESALYTTTDRRGATSRNETYGWGVMNVNAALQAVAVLPQVGWPRSTFPVETTSTLISAVVHNAVSSSVQVTIDGQPASPPVTVQSVDSRTVRIANTRTFAPGAHTLSITASSPATGRARSTEVRFQVAPRVLQPGWYMLSLPYKLASAGTDPATVFGGHPFRMARWLAATKEYAYFDPETSRRDARATFGPSGPNVTDSPAGMGYWVRLTEPTELVLEGEPVLASEYRVTLAKGWTMVGNPYTVPISLASLQYQVGSQKLPLTQAISRGWIGRSIYTYASGSSGAGAYVLLRPDTGVLAPYQAAWVQANSAGTLIVTGG